MFHRLLLICSLLASFAMAGAAVAGTRPITLLTENFPPYNMATNGKNYAQDENVIGIAAELVREMFRRAEVPYNLSLRFPWERIYKLALDNPDHGVFVMARVPEREALFKWVGPLGPDDWVLLARKDSKIQLDNLDQARGLRIGAYKGDAIALALTRKKMSPVVALRDQDNARKLVDKQIDLWATGDPAGRYLARLAGYTNFRTVLRFNSASLYLGLNRAVPDEVVARLQKALDEMRADGFVQKTMDKYL